MNTEKFLIIKKIKDLIIYLDKVLDNFPNKYLELKKEVYKEIYGMLKLSYLANNTDNLSIKKQRIYELISSVNYIDFLNTLCYEKKIINNKKYVKIGDNLEIILKYIVGWNKSIK